MMKKKRLWVIPIAIIVVPDMVMLVVGQFTPVLTTWLLRPLIGSTTFTAPPNFEVIQENVIVKKNIPYNEHGTLLDIYYPENVDPPMPVIMWIHGVLLYDGGYDMQAALISILSIKRESF